jgi:hypothetical protein
MLADRNEDAPELPQVTGVFDAALGESIQIRSEGGQSAKPREPVARQPNSCAAGRKLLSRPVRAELLLWRLRIAYVFVTQSGRGQPHSKTLARNPMRQKTQSVLECGCPLPLLSPREE